MKIGVLTSSRADYGIYQPLLKELERDTFFDLHVLAFGTHLSKKHGFSLEHILKDNHKVSAQFDTCPENDSAEDICKSMALTISKFSEFWTDNTFDLIIALGDRYEMFAAVASTLPFNIKVAHIHGGETTLGAIDNAFRHSITSMSNIHFTAAEPYRKRVIEITGSDKNVYNVGALSIDNQKQMVFLSIEEFKSMFGINMALPSILITFHPETKNTELNKTHIEELIFAFEELRNYQLIITMPNADTMGNYIRNKLNAFITSNENAIGVENFGSLGYLSCMKHCKLMLGNSSSGFIEAYGLKKAVVNIGDRQKGRILTPNIFNSIIEKNHIIKAVREAEKHEEIKNEPIYGEGNTAEMIVRALKEMKS